MKRNEIMATFRSLAHSQGCYGRLVNELESMSEEQFDEVMTKLENQNFKDSVDLILFIEN